MMENLLVVILAAALLIYALSWVKIYIRLLYRRQEADDFIRIEVYLLHRLLAYELDIPMVQIIEHRGLPWLESEINPMGKKVKKKSGVKKSFIAMTELYKPGKLRHILREVSLLFRVYQKFARRIQSKMKCEKFFWRTGCGCDDAALTAMISGFLWVLKSEIFIFLQRRINFAVKPVMQVRSNFTKVLFQVEFECIFTIRVGNVINAVWSLLHFPVKGVKGSG